MPSTPILRACAVPALLAGLLLAGANNQRACAEPARTTHTRPVAKPAEPEKPAEPTAAPAPGPLDAPSVLVPEPQKSLVEAVTAAGSRLVAVGLHGLVLLSDDHGLSWRQVQAPVRATLTAVLFADDHTGWAIGHYGVVLRTENGGESWTLVLDAPRAERITLDAALSANASDAQRQKNIDAARRLAASDPSLPFLLMQADGTDTLRAIGAGGLALETDDAGRHWHPWSNAIENPDTLPLLGLAVRDGVVAVDGGGGILLAGRPENGLARLKTPTDATLFGAIDAGRFGILLFGQQGNAFAGTLAQPVSATKADSWHPVDSPTQNSFTAALLKRDGTVLLGDSAGMVWTLDGKPDDPRLLVATPRAPFPILGMADPGDGGLVLAGSGGVLRIDPPAPPATAQPSNAQPATAPTQTPAPASATPAASSGAAAAPATKPADAATPPASAVPAGGTTPGKPDAADRPHG